MPFPSLRSIAIADPLVHPPSQLLTLSLPFGVLSDPSFTCPQSRSQRPQRAFKRSHNALALNTSSAPSNAPSTFPQMRPLCALKHVLYAPSNAPPTPPHKIEDNWTRHDAPHGMLPRARCLRTRALVLRVVLRRPFFCGKVAHLSRMYTPFTTSVGISGTDDICLGLCN
jgi:hypothetical protein